MSTKRERCWGGWCKAILTSGVLARGALLRVGAAGFENLSKHHSIMLSYVWSCFCYCSIIDVVSGPSVGHSSPRPHGRSGNSTTLPSACTSRARKMYRLPSAVVI
jgi:hypothetical protein